MGAKAADPSFFLASRRDYVTSINQLDYLLCASWRTCIRIRTRTRLRIASHCCEAT